MTLDFNWLVVKITLHKAHWNLNLKSYLKPYFNVYACTYILHLIHLCALWGIPLCSILRWSGVLESSRAGLTLLALYFSRHFRSQQLREWFPPRSSTYVSYRRASPYVFSDYSLIFETQLCPWDDSAGMNRIYSQPTHIGTVRNCLSPSRRNFHWIHTHTHTHRVRSCVEPRLRGTDTSSSVTAPPWVRNESQQLSTRIWACFKFISKSCFSRAG